VTEGQTKLNFCIGYDIVGQVFEVSCVYRWEWSAFLDEILDDNKSSEYSSEEESSKGDDYMQLLLPRTHKIKDSVDGDDMLHVMMNRCKWE
jgi:hypothetical protein